MIDLAHLRPRIVEILADYQNPGAAIGVLHEGRATELVLGVQDITTGRAVTSETMFQCGSLTKSWTALAFLQMVDEGAVALDEPVRHYLPRFRVADAGASAAVTPRHLLNHTHGIEESYGDPGEGEDVYERMVEALADAPQVSPLGHTHGYSPAAGYAILARIMEAVDGKAWDAVMADRLVSRMGLRSTSTWWKDVDPRRAARGHLVRTPEEGPIPTPVDHLPRAFGAGGGMSSTAGDVLALAHVLLHGGLAPNGHRVLSPGMVREMTASRVPIPDPYLVGQEWALGLVVLDWHGCTVYGHDGSTIGQNARLRILPDADLAMVLLTNGDARESLCTRVFDVILRELGAVAIPPLPEPDLTLQLDPARYVGVYERPGNRFEVTADRGRLRLDVDVDPFQAEVTGLPRRITHDLLPIDEQHFLVTPSTPMAEMQTAALYEFHDGQARYLHIDARLHPRQR
jgi:CubicO group peptidase (beta-lactamase class C family)